MDKFIHNQQTIEAAKVCEGVWEGLKLLAIMFALILTW